MAKTRRRKDKKKMERLNDDQDIKVENVRRGRKGNFALFFQSGESRNLSGEVVLQLHTVDTELYSELQCKKWAIDDDILIRKAD